MKSWRFLAWLLGCALLLGALVHSLPRLKIESDLLAMLPADARDPLAEAASQQMTEALSKRLVVLVGNADLNRARAAADAYAAVLDSSRLFAPVQLEASADAIRPSPAELASRYALISAEDRATLQTPGGAEMLKARANAELYSPSSFGRLTRIADDPLGLYEHFLQAGLSAPGKTGLESGVLTAHADGKVWVLVLASTRDSPFGYRQQDALTAALADARSAAETEGGSVLVSGVAPHALASAARAQTEIKLLGSIETLLTVLLLWTVFAALRPVLLTLMAMALGVAAGVMACHLVFGKLHVMTLVFGSSLVGIAIDYSLHFLCDQFRDPLHWRPRDALPQVGKSLTMGLATTTLGYVAFATAPMPVLRQMAVFSTAGLVMAYLTVCCAYPVLAGVTRLRASSRGWMRLADQLKPHRLHWGFWALLALFCIGGLMKLRFADDLRLLQSSHPQLMAEERAVHATLGALTDRRFYLVSGANAEEVLQREEALTARLQTLRASGAVGSWQALSRLVPSARTQTANRALLAPLYTQSGAVGQQLVELGYEPDSMARSSATFAAAPPLTLTTALQSPRFAALSLLWLGELHGAFASVVVPSGVTDEAALIAAAEGLPGVRWRDPVQSITATLKEQRQTAAERMVAVYALTVLLLMVIYGWRNTPRFIFPSLGASLLTLAALGWLGIAANLFTILALLLVLGLGVDYAIFLRDTAHTPISSRLGVVLAALTTLFAFGGLSFSATPFLRAIGLTLTLGIFLSLSLALLTARPADHAPAP